MWHQWAKVCGWSLEYCVVAKAFWVVARVFCIGATDLQAKRLQKELMPF